MDLDQIIEKLELKQERLFHNLPLKKRLIFKNIFPINNRGILYYGPRGVGKTTFLLMKSKDKNMLYISGDDPIISQISIYELSERAFLNGYSGVIVDEVHYINNWGMQIKALYDSFPDREIWISDSSGIVLKKGLADLSRRFIKVRIPLLSFREYIHLKEGIEYETLDDPFEKDKNRLFSIANEINVLKLFREYIESGTRPFFLEGHFEEKMINILEKTIYSDIPFFLSTVNENHLRLIKSVVGYLLVSKIPTINVEGMCKKFSVGKNKLYELLNVMDEIDLINVIHKEKDFSVYSKGKKIFLADPSYYYIFNGETGNAREAYVVFTLREKAEVFASKNEEEGDFIWRGIKIEVGGKSKKAKKADFVVSDDLDIPYKNKVPLWGLGFLW